MILILFVLLKYVCFKIFRSKICRDKKIIRYVRYFFEYIDYGVIKIVRLSNGI